MAESVCDTSPIQYLYQTNLLHLLPTLFGSVTVPEAVVREVAEGRKAGVSLPVLESLPWIVVGRPQQEVALTLLQDLGAGETEVLALALEHSGNLALLDDAIARGYAKQLGVKCIGTLGILLKAKKSAELKVIAPILYDLDRLRFRLDPRTRTAVLKLAGEAD